MFTSEGCSIPLGSCLFGIPIKLHLSFFILLALNLLNALNVDGLFSAWFWLIAILYGPVLLMTIIVHELGHALMNRRFGGTASHMVLWPLGGYVILGETDGINVMEDFWVALAGPLTHIPMGTMWFALFLIFNKPSDFSYNADTKDDLKTFDLTSSSGFLSVLFREALYLNIILFAFNLFVPAYPLDGGRILAALLVKCGMPVPRAAIVTSVTAMTLAGCMMAYGVYGLVFKGTASILMILVGAFIFYLSYGLFRLTRVGKVHDHPLFSKNCYREANGQGVPENGEINTGMANSTPETEMSQKPSFARRMLAVARPKKDSNVASDDPNFV